MGEGKEGDSTVSGDVNEPFPRTATCHIIPWMYLIAGLNKVKHFKTPIVRKKKTTAKYIHIQLRSELQISEILK